MTISFSLFINSNRNNIENLIVIPKDRSVKFYPDPDDYQKKTGKKIFSFNESPSLKKASSRGIIPTLKSRLPDKPMVIEPAQKTGSYGGILHHGWKGFSDELSVRKLQGECFLQWGSNGVVLTGIPESFKISDNGKIIKFTLRKGMKWSDGHPLTTDDISFHFEHVLKNKEFMTNIPDFWTPGGFLPELKIIDKYSYLFVFRYPSGSFLFNCARRNYNEFIQPAHYLKQFHPDFTSRDKLNKMIKEKGYKKILDLFYEKQDFIRNPMLPTITAWIVQNDYRELEVIFKRNPYYYKIDSSGNQLPYINEINNIFIENKEDLLAKITNSKIDFQFRSLSLSDSRTLLKRKKNYYVMLCPSSHGSNVCIYLNHTVQDVVKRELFNNKNFKKALSLSIDRNEINRINHDGFAVPRQASFPDGGLLYDREWETLYADYDLKQANEILDMLGLAEKNADGIRLLKNGKPLEITFEYYSDYTKDIDLLKKQLLKAGIEIIDKKEDRELMYKRYRVDNVHEAIIGTFDRTVRPDIDTRHLIPFDSNNFWGTGWGIYYDNKGKKGIKPDNDIFELQKIYESLQSEGDDSMRKKLLQKAVDIHKKNIYIIGIIGLKPTIAVFNKKLSNIPYFINEEIYRTPGNAYCWQWFYE